MLVIACAFLFGAAKAKKGLGCLFVGIALAIIGVLLAQFVLGFMADSSITETAVEDDSAIEQDGSYLSDDYLEVSFVEFSDELANGIDLAKAKYLNQKVIVVGRYDEMNLNGKTQLEGVTEDSIVLSDIDEDADDAVWVVGHIQTDEQRETAQQFSECEMVVIKGVITDINELSVFIDIEDMD